MTAKLTRLTYKIAIQVYLVQRAVTFAVLAPGGQSRNFWIHPRMLRYNYTNTSVNHQNPKMHYLDGERC
jgi:hypothetical protein